MMTLYKMESEFKEIWASGPSVEITVSYTHDQVIECVISPHNGLRLVGQGESITDAAEVAIRRYRRWVEDSKEKDETSAVDRNLAGVFLD